MCFDYEVREISPLTNSWFVVSLNVTKGELPQKIEPGADPEDYHSSQLKEFLMDGGVPESDIQTVNKRIRLPATKWNKKLLDKWYCYHRNVTVYQIEIDPRTRLPIFEILY